MEAIPRVPEKIRCSGGRAAEPGQGCVKRDAITRSRLSFPLSSAPRRIELFRAPHPFFLKCAPKCAQLSSLFSGLHWQKWQKEEPTLLHGEFLFSVRSVHLPTQGKVLHQNPISLFTSYKVKGMWSLWSAVWSEGCVILSAHCTGRYSRRATIRI